MEVPVLPPVITRLDTLWLCIAVPSGFTMSIIARNFTLLPWPIEELVLLPPVIVCPCIEVPVLLPLLPVVPVLLLLPEEVAFDPVLELFEVAELFPRLLDAFEPVEAPADPLALPELIKLENP